MEGEQQDLQRLCKARCRRCPQERPYRPVQYCRASRGPDIASQVLARWIKWRVPRRIMQLQEFSPLQLRLVHCQAQCPGLSFITVTCLACSLPHWIQVAYLAHSLPIMMPATDSVHTSPTMMPAIREQALPITSRHCPRCRVIQAPHSHNHPINNTRDSPDWSGLPLFKVARILRSLLKLAQIITRIPNRCVRACPLLTLDHTRQDHIRCFLQMPRQTLFLPLCACTHRLTSRKRCSSTHGVKPA